MKMHTIVYYGVCDGATSHDYYSVSNIGIVSKDYFVTNIINSQSLKLRIFLKNIDGV